MCHLLMESAQEFLYQFFVNSALLHLFQSRYTSQQEKTMQSSELESGLPDEAEQESIVFFFLRSYRVLNSKPTVAVILKT